MTIRALITGSLSKEPIEKTSSKGNAYLIANIREGSGDAARYVSAFVFTNDALAIIRELQVGEPLSVAGELTVEICEWNGKQKLNWSIRADAVLSVQRPPKAAESRTSTTAEHPARRSGAAPGGKPVHPSTPLDDDIPFAPERRLP